MEVDEMMLRLRARLAEPCFREMEPLAEGLSRTSSATEASLFRPNGLHLDADEPLGVFTTSGEAVGGGAAVGGGPTGDVAVVEADDSRVVLKLSIDVTLFRRDDSCAKGIESC